MTVLFYQINANKNVDFRFLHSVSAEVYQLDIRHHVSADVFTLYMVSVFTLKWSHASPVCLCLRLHVNSASQSITQQCKRVVDILFVQNTNNLFF